MHGTLMAATALLFLAFGLATSAPAQTRVDTYDTKSNRTGYLLVDPKTGRIDTFDTKSNRTGYGQVTPSGRVDFYDTKSNRTGHGQISPGSTPRGARR